MTADIVERLRGLHVTRHPSRSVVECDETTILEAAAEIERLRAALRDVVECWDWRQVCTDARDGAVAAKAIEDARAALGEKA